MSLSLHDLVKYGVIFVGIVLAVLAGIFISNDQVWLPALLVCFIVMGAFVLSQPQNAVLLVLACAPLIDRSSILPMNFGPFHLTVLFLGVISVVFWATKRISLRTGNIATMAGLGVLAAILLYHMKASGSGLAVLGAGGEGMTGGRTYIGFFFGVLAYFLILSFPPCPALRRHFGWFALFGPAVVAMIDVIAFVDPQLLPYIAVFYMGFSFEDLLAYQRDTFELIRIAGLRELGVTVALVACSYFPVKQLYLPRRWILILILAIGFVFILLGGFRAFLIEFTAVFFLFAVFDTGWRSIGYVIAAAVALFALAAGQGHYFHLPVYFQRVLTFLPGDWDSRPLLEAEDSVEWRGELWHYFIVHRLHESPWIGTGFTVSTFYFGQMADYYLGDARSITSHALSKSWHSGILYTYDCAGTLGLLAWLAVLAGIGSDVVKGIRRWRTPASSPALRYFTVALLCMIFLNMYGSGIGDGFSVLLVYAAFLRRLALEPAPEELEAPPQPAA